MRWQCELIKYRSLKSSTLINRLTSAEGTYGLVSSGGRLVANRRNNILHAGRTDGREVLREMNGQRCCFASKQLA